MSYNDTVREWAKTGSAQLSDECFIQSAMAAVAGLGPVKSAHSHLKKQLDELKKARDTCTAQTSIDVVSRIDWSLETIIKKLAEKEKELERALEHLQETTLESSRQLSRRIADDRAQYASAMSAMEAMANTDKRVLEDVTLWAEKINNDGPLEVGVEAEVVDNGRLARVKVEKKLPSDQYEVTFWVELPVSGLKYEAGFKTRSRRVLVFPRRKIYANKKQRQTISLNTLQLLGQTVVTASSTDPLFLMMLYADAELSLERLRALCCRIEALVPDASPVVPGLKGMGRAFAKTLEKYQGDFSNMTDLARATIKCPSLAVLLAALKELKEDKAFEIVLIKNRMMPAFDADEAGGYRDMLINLRDEVSGHIVELQATLDPLLEVKKNGKGGHVAYEIGRLLGLFDKNETEHRGMITTHVLKGVECGLLRILECQGPATEFGIHMDRFFEAAKSGHCALTEVEISGSGWPAHRKVSEMLEVFMDHCGGTLARLVIDQDPAVKGEFPESLFERLPKLRNIDISQVNTTGPIPSSICSAKLLQRLCFCDTKMSGGIPIALGQLHNLKEVFLCSNQLTGSIPFELGKLKNLEKLSLYSNHLIGPIPPELGELLNLKVLLLHSNQLSGRIPDALKQLENLQELSLHQNQLSGRIPLELGQLQRLTHLWLHGNPLLSGPVPLALRDRAGISIKGPD